MGPNWGPYTALACFGVLKSMGPSVVNGAYVYIYIYICICMYGYIGILD